MRLCLALAAIAGLSLTTPVLAGGPIQPSPQPVVWHQCQSGNTTPSAVTTGATAQPLIGSNAAVTFPIVGLYVYNPSTATLQGISNAESLLINLAGTAVVDARSLELVPGAPLSMGPGTITNTNPSVIAATTGHAFTCFFGTSQ